MRLYINFKNQKYTNWNNNMSEFTLPVISVLFSTSCHHFDMINHLYTKLIIPIPANQQKSIYN